MSFVVYGTHGVYSDQVFWVSRVCDTEAEAAAFTDACNGWAAGAAEHVAVWSHAERCKWHKDDPDEEAWWDRWEARRLSHGYVNACPDETAKRLVPQRLRRVSCGYTGYDGIRWGYVAGEGLLEGVK